MQVTQLLALYAAVGVACALVLRRRRALQASGIDALLVVIAWPLYVPCLLDASHVAGAGERVRIDRERAALLAAVRAVTDPAIAPLLPSEAQIAQVAGRLHSLDAKVVELDALLSHGETSVQSAEAALAAAEARGLGVEDARRLLESVRRLVSLREAAARERDELFAACARLRAHMLVVRYSSVAAEDVRALVAEIIGRVEDAESVVSPQAT
jgi:hypothetical protein